MRLLVALVAVLTGIQLATRRERVGCWLGTTYRVS